MGKRYVKDNNIIKGIILASIAFLILLGLFFLGYKIYKYIKSPKPQSETVSQTVIKEPPTINPNEIIVTPPTPNYSNVVTDEVAGVWIASVLNIDFPSKPNLDVATLKKEIDDIIITAKSSGLNTIFFQVRPTADALYKSSLFPTSHWLTGKQGQPLIEGFDPLDYAIKQSHKQNMKLHAWLNPFRVTSSAEFTQEMLAENSPAKLHPEWVIKHTDGKLYFNPGIPQVRELVINGVLEIVKNYDIDGIHYDDYFYPSEKFDDDTAYKKYGIDFKNIGDWRRENVNILIKNTYEAIKKEKSAVLFGVSPFGIWANKENLTDGSNTNGLQSYFSHFADSKKWVKQGYIDYICPQLYWGINQKGQDFNILCDWWANVVKGTNVKLYVGHAVYKISNVDENFKNPNEITNQIAYSKQKENYGGSVFYGYSNIKNNFLGIKDKLYSYYLSTKKQNKLSVSNPSNDTILYSDKCFAIGSYNSLFPLTVNGIEITDKTNSGYFSLYLDLKMGANNFLIENGQQKYSLKLTRKVPQSKTLYMNKFEISQCYPDDSRITLLEGEQLSISATAPAGAIVWAVIDGQKIDLTTGSLPPANKKLLSAVYTGKYIMPNKANGKIVNIGKPIFYAKGFSKTAQKEAKSDILVMSADYKRVATVNKDNVFLRPFHTIDNFNDSYPAFKGLSDYITGEQYIFDERMDKYSAFVRLSCGLWLEKEYVDITEEKTLNFSEISKAQLLNTKKYTVLELTTKEKSPCFVIGYSDRVEIVVFNAGSFTNSVANFIENPLFSNISNRADGNKFIYTLTLKKADMYLGYKVKYEDGKINVLLKNPSRFISKEKPLTGIKIALDAGHGTTPGAYGPLGTLGFLEKDINFSIVQSIKKYLEGYGATVVLSRGQEGGRDVREIVPFYSEQEVDLALSIHNNSLNLNKNPIDQIGAESYYATAQTKKAAEIILDKSCLYANRPKRFTEKGDYIVSRYHQCPAVLLEAGYMSNIYEYEWLSNEQNRDFYGHCIATSIIDYFKWQNS